VNNKDDCFKLHHVGYLINTVTMHGTTNIKITGFVAFALILTVEKKPSMQLNA
jgi:hypothetical protein